MIIFSDIHANLPALQKFFSLIDSDESKVCLGDIIGYGASPSECLRLVKENNATIIRGNHEGALLNSKRRLFFSFLARSALEWTEKRLSPHEIEGIRAFPESILKQNVLFVHGSPVDPDTYINDEQSVRNAFSRMTELQASMCFFGHTHIPGFYDNSGVFRYSTEHDYVLEEDEPYLINPGSIGQPRDGKTGLSYCSWNPDTRILRFHRASYNIEQAANKIRKAGLPELLADRLFSGR